MPLRAVRLGADLLKSISLGIRAGEETVDNIAGFVKTALEVSS